VIDLSDAREQQPERSVCAPQFDVDELSQGLAERAAEIFPPLFPHSRIVGDELRMADINGNSPRKEGSCVVKLKGSDAGCHYDHSTGKGGRPLSTLKKATGLNGRELLEDAAERIGGTPAKPYEHDRSRRTDEERTAREIAFIRQGCVPARGTLVETYLNSRGLDLPDCDDIQFHPDLTDYKAKRGRPGIVTILRRPDTGEPTGSIHRTFLSDDGSGKADMPKPKLTLGSPAGGVAMLMPMTVDGTLGMAEGQETALAAAKIFGIPVWAGISAEGVRSFIFPTGLKRLLILADRGTAGENAGADLHQRALAAGIDVSVYLPRGDDDFADDLNRGDCRAEDYPPLRPIDQQPLLEQPQVAVEIDPVWQRPSLELIHFREMQPQIADKSIVGDMLNEREISAFVGASGTGKTFLVIDLALHVAAGRTWLDRATRQTGVVYIAAEAGRGIINRVAVLWKCSIRSKMLNSTFRSV
jgi:hypothetical protein